MIKREATYVTLREDRGQTGRILMCVLGEGSRLSSLGGFGKCRATTPSAFSVFPSLYVHPGDPHFLTLPYGVLVSYLSYLHHLSRQSPLSLSFPLTPPIQYDLLFLSPGNFLSHTQQPVNHTQHISFSYQYPT